MAGFASYDDLINEITTNGKKDDYSFNKSALGTAGIAGVWQSLWSAAGNPPSGALAASGTGTVYTGANRVGGMTFPDVSPDLRFGLVLGASSTVNCNLMIYDRLCASSLTGTNALTTSGSKSMSMTVPRYTGTYGYGNQVWVEFTTGITTNALNIQVQSYTDADSNGTLSGAYTAIATASGTVGCMWPLPMSGANRGITAISSIQISGTVPAAGAANIVILRPIARLPLSANIWNEKDLVMQLASLPRIWDGACLATAVLNTGTGQPPPQGVLEVGWG